MLRPDLRETGIVSRISAFTTSVGLGAICSPYTAPRNAEENALDFLGAYRTSHAPKYYRGQFGSGGRQCNPAVARKVLAITLPLLVRPNAEPRDKHAPTDLDSVGHGFQKIAMYQDICAMALYANDIILSVVGAVTGFLLPVLYAWLGACAAIL